MIVAEIPVFFYTAGELTIFMPVLQYQCQSCFSYFEHLVSAFLKEKAACVTCGSAEIERVFALAYYPNKSFCPHEKTIEMNAETIANLPKIFSNSDLRCRGCGVDGPKGNCSTPSLGACKNCTCGKGGCSR